MAATNRNSATKARKVEAQGKALELRRMGLGYAEIAHQIGCSTTAAHRYVRDAMADAKAQIDADAGEMKAEEISRLDGMLRGLWPDARKGNHGAVDRVLKIMERRAKLLGLDAPVRHALGGDAGAPPIETRNDGIELSRLTDEELAQLEALRHAADSRRAGR
jgi:hypothetical protein